MGKIYSTLTINKPSAEKVNIFKYFVLHIFEDITWSTYSAAVKKATIGMTGTCGVSLSHES